VEGMPGWLPLAGIVLFGLMGLAVVPALAAVGLWLAGRTYPARVLFATALLCEAILWAASCFLILWVDLPSDLWRGLAVALTGLSLLLAGAGQFVAALRSPRTFAVALAFAAGAVAVIVVGTPLRYHVRDWVDVPLAWLDVFPDWTSLVVAIPSLALAIATLMSAVLLSSGPRRTGAQGAEAGGRGRAIG
jgi:hypothetical protein